MTEIWDQSHTDYILTDVFDERHRQVQKWGVQKHTDGTSPEDYAVQVELFKNHNDHQAMHGRDNSWDTILLEEVFEALAETDPVKLREELVQSAAVIVAWIEDLESRKDNAA